jgi:hypothetical protein
VRIVSIIPYPINEPVVHPPSERMCSDGERAGDWVLSPAVDYLAADPAGMNVQSSNAIHRSAQNACSRKYAYPRSNTYERARRSSAERSDRWKKGCTGPPLGTITVHS